MENPHKGKTGFIRMWNAFHYSMSGLKAAYKHEDAFRQETMLAIIFIPLALLLPLNGMAKALLVGSILMVIIIELINSAIEATVDRISFEDHRLAKRAKDIGSAAVLIALINAVVIWALVLSQK